MADGEALLPKHGGYRKLKSYQIAELIFDVTVRFCDRYIDKRSRTHDQMVQAGRSGVRNITEGSQASATSKKTEIKLTGVARASIEELRKDYEDFLKHRRFPLWDRDDPRRVELIARRCATADDFTAWTRDAHDGRCGQRGQGGQRGRGETGSGSTPSTASMKSMSSRRSTYAEIAANGVLTLIAVVAPLLDRQIASQMRAFQREGGFTERLYRIRSEKRRGGPFPPAGGR